MSSPIISAFLLLGSMVSITAGAAIAKDIFPILGPAGSTFLRLAVAGLILVVVRRPWMNSLNSRQWRWTLIYGAVLGLMNLLFYFAIARLPIGLAIAIEFLGPLAVTLSLSRHIWDLLWALLAFVGVCLMMPQVNSSVAVDLIGVLFALGAAAEWASYILIGRKAGNLVPAANATAYGMIVGCLLAAPFGAVPALQLVNHPAVIPAALAVGLLSSAIPYSLEMVALKHLSAKTFGILLSLEAAIGALSGFLILHENLSAIQLLAIFCVMVASAGSIVSSDRLQKKDLQAEISG